MKGDKKIIITSTKFDMKIKFNKMIVIKFKIKINKNNSKNPGGRKTFIEAHGTKWHKKHKVSRGFWQR